MVLSSYSGLNRFGYTVLNIPAVLIVVTHIVVIVLNMVRRNLVAIGVGNNKDLLSYK